MKNVHAHEYVLTMLGAKHIGVEIDSKDVDVALSQALRKYSLYVPKLKSAYFASAPGVQSYKVDTEGMPPCFVQPRTAMPLPGLVDACLAGSTKISLLDGRELSLLEVEQEFGSGEFWVYSLNADGALVPGAARALRKTREQAELVEVELDNGQKIRCTPEHRFMLRDGSYCEAQKLQAGSSLMPLYRRVNSAGYEEYMDHNGRWKFTHRQVATEVYGCPRSDSTGRYLSGWHVHHGTWLPEFTVGRKLDNRPENLVWIPGLTHWQLHHDLGMLGRDQLVERNRSPRQRAICSEARKKYIQRHPEVLEVLAAGQRRWLSSKEGEAYLNSSERKRISSETLHELWKQEAVAGRMRANLQRKDALWLDAVRTGIQANRDVNLSAYRTNAARQHRAPGRLRSISEGGRARTCGTGFVYDRNLQAVLALVEGELSEQTYKLARTAFIRQGAYSRLVPTFEKVLQRNHKVVAVHALSKREDVYDFTVDGHHNFALSAGVFVHNSFDIFRYPFYEAIAGPAIAGTFSGIGHIDAYFRWLSSTAKVLSAEFDWEYDENSGTLMVTPLPQAVIPFQVIYPAPKSTDNVPERDEDILLDLTLAYSKQILARILRKFAEIPGSTLTIPTDGSELMKEGLEAEQRVLETLKARAIPPPFIQG